MEYVAGGNMADYILKTILLKFGSFDTRDGLVMEEDEARYFFTQVSTPNPEPSTLKLQPHFDP
jgi:hypothetical protein